jgi:protein-arginine kinase activator protein McsA
MYKCEECGKDTENFEKWILPPKTQREFEELGEGYSICDECIKKGEEEEEFANEQWQKDNITCPACGYEYTDSWEFDEDDDEVICQSCEATFALIINREVTYSTRRIKKDEPEVANE